MKFNVSEKEIALAKLPHDLFLVNLIGNHILVFVATLGLASSWAWPMLMVPIVSLSIIGYTVYRAGKAAQNDPWFVMCHWKLALKRSQVLMIMILIGSVVVATGYVLYTHFGVMKEAAMAFVGGVGLLPVMITVLILIILESDTLHQAAKGELPESMVKRFSEGQYQPAEQVESA